MCFNTFIKYNRHEIYKQFGFSPCDENDRFYNPIHWFQFADDAAVVTMDERENQLLLNCYTKWCQWSMVQIRVDKCVAFGLKKFSTRSMQFQPNLLIIRKLYLLLNLGNYLDNLAAISSSRWMIKTISPNTILSFEYVAAYRFV